MLTTHLLTIGLFATISLGTGSGESPDPRDDFRPNMTLIWEVWNPTIEHFIAYVDAAVSRDVNSISIHIPWNLVEPEEGKFVWDWLDPRMDHVAARGLRIWPRIECGKSVPDWVGAEHLAHLQDGTVYVSEQHGKHFLALADGKVRELLPRLMHEVAARYENRYHETPGALPHPVLFYSIHLSPPVESEYAHDLPIDFSPSMRASYREWIEERFEGNIDSLNAAWTTRYASFDEITLEASPRFDHATHRNLVLAEILAEVGRAVRSVPMARFGVQFGCIWDYLSRPRATRDVYQLIREADWIVVDDGFQMDWAFSMDYLRGMAGHRRICNELDGPWHPYISDEAAMKQWQVSLAHGVDGMSCANWGTWDLIDREKWTFWEPLAAALREPKTEVKPTRAVLLTMAGIRALPDEIDVGAAARKAYATASESWSFPVDVINDSILRDDPDLLDRYVDGIFLPSSNRRMSDETFAILLRVEVPLFVEDVMVGTEDPYGRVRKEKLSEAPFYVEPEE